MSSIGRMALRFPYRVTAVGGFVLLLCVCVVIQMLGVPATFVDLLSSDTLAKLEPVSEDHTTVSSSSEPERPRLLTLVTESHPVRHLPILTTSVFRPPSL